MQSASTLLEWRLFLRPRFDGSRSRLLDLFQPNQAAVGMVDNSESRFKSPCTLTPGVLSALYLRNTPGATGHRAGRASMKSSP